MFFYFEVTVNLQNIMEPQLTELKLNEKMWIFASAVILVEDKKEIDLIK